MAATLQLNYTGGASNSTPSASLGGAHSSSALNTTALNNLFEDVQPSDATAGITEYRAVDLTNTDASSASASTSIYMLAETTSTSTQINMGIESSPTTSTTSIANGTTAPSGVTFSHYNSGTKLSLPSVPASGYVRVWIKRVVSAGAANLANDTGTIAWDYA